jgi:hypothetical protein
MCASDGSTGSSEERGQAIAEATNLTRFVVFIEVSNESKGKLFL